MGSHQRKVQKRSTKKTATKKDVKGIKKQPVQLKKRVTKERKGAGNQSVGDEHSMKVWRVAESKKIWETLRLRKLDLKERHSLIEKILDLWKGNLKKACLRPDTCRVIQSVIKYGNEHHKSILIHSLFQDVTELAKDRYGHFILVKLFRYCTKEQIDEVVSLFRGQLVSLMRNKYASDVIDFLYQAVANAEQKRILLQELYCGGNSHIMASLGDSLKDVFSLPSFLAKIGSEFRETILSSISSLLDSFSNNTKLMQSALVHRLAKEYFEEVNTKMRKVLTSSLISHSVVMLHTREGSQVVIECVKLAEPSEKKQLAKSLKADLVKVGLDEYGHRVLLSLIHFTDDTAMLENVIFREIIRNAKTLIADKHGRLPILHLLCPFSKRYFHPTAYSFLTNEDMNEINVKKDFQTRRQELLDLIHHSLEQVLLENLQVFICNNFAYVVVLEFILYLSRKGEDISNWLEAIEDVYCSQLEEKLQRDKSIDTESSSFVDTRFPARILRIVCNTVSCPKVYQHVQERIGKYKDVLQDVEDRRLASAVDVTKQIP